MKKIKKIHSEKSGEKPTDINRRQVIKELGKYAVVTALGTFLILSPKKAQATSPPPPGDGF